MKHPYGSAPDRAFWSKSVSRDFHANALMDETDILIRKHQKIISAGSCFASNLVPYIEKAGFTYLRTESKPAVFAQTPTENLGYAKFSAAYGNVYTVRQMLQLLRRATGSFKPIEDRWFLGERIVDPFRPGLRYFARSVEEFDILTRQHLAAAYEAFTKADILIFTLGLTEAWVSRQDGAVYPACPGTIAGDYDPEKHLFINFRPAEVLSDLDQFIFELRELNPKITIILTVSPVPLVATATNHHVVRASTYSKSVLRVAAEDAALNHRQVYYFPAYEIITGPQAPKNYFEDDRRNVSAEGINTVMTAFLSRCEGGMIKEDLSKHPENQLGKHLLDQHLPASMDRETKPVATFPSLDIQATLSRQISEAECDEAMLDI